MLEITPLYIEYHDDCCSDSCPFSECYKTMNGDHKRICRLFKKDIIGNKRCFDCFKVAGTVKRSIESNNSAWARAYNRVSRIIKGVYNG